MIAPVQQLADDTVAWLSRNGYRVPAAQVVVGDQAPMIAGTAPQGSGVSLSPQWAQALAGTAKKRGKAVGFNERAYLRLLMHELMHRPAEARPGLESAEAQGWEEAAAQASAEDVLPAYLKQLFGARAPMPRKPGATDRYADRVKSLRQMSVFASGARKWNDREARVWRRAFSNASVDERNQMLAAGRAARAEWGARVGR